MHRIYISQASFQDTFLTLDDPQELHHLKDVLRLKEGEELEVVNGVGLLLTCRVRHVGKKAAELDVSGRQEMVRPSGIKIVLACAVPKKTKFETIIEKCTELGVDEIVPLLTERTEMRMAASARKDERFFKVVVNAAKQSKRTFFPILHPVMKFDDVLARFLVPGSLSLIPWLEGDRVPLKMAVQKTSQEQGVVVLIGPEGDFTPDEVARAIARGAVAVSLGETTLKVDTAAISVVAALRLGCS